MKVPVKGALRGSETLGQYCARTFSRNGAGSGAAAKAISLYSGVPLFAAGMRCKWKRHAAFHAIHGTVVT
jgi:hypothetical protein